MIITEIPTIHEDFGFDITKAITHSYWKEKTLNDHIKSALIYNGETVMMVNDPTELRRLADFMFNYYANETKAQCNHTFLMRNDKKMIFVNFFSSDCVQQHDFNPFLL